MKETNNLKKEPSKMKELWQDFRDGPIGVTLVFAVICAVIVGIFAYIFMVLAPEMKDIGEELKPILILSAVGIFLFIVLIAILKTTFSLLRAKLAIIIQISLLILTILSIAFSCALPFIVMGATFEEGDFSNVHECSICGKPADGGRGIYRTGMSKEDEEVHYFCVEDFILIQERTNNNDKNEINESDVWYEAKEIVKNRLKAPSTASFCSKSSATITKSGKTWVIEGYVDAENSFGAMIRNDFTVVLVFKNETQYTISNCTITPR